MPEKDKPTGKCDCTGGCEDVQGGLLFCVKIYRRMGEVLVAVADSEIVGKVFRGDGIKIEVTESFYHGDTVGEEAMLQRLRLATIANLVGNRCVRSAIEHGFIDGKNVIRIGEVSHAQFARMSP